MTEYSLSNLLFSYMKKERKNLFLLLIFFLISGLMAYLYRFPLEAALYAALLCLAAAFPVSAIGFFRYRERILSLRNVMKHSGETLDGLPEPADMLEDAYQQLLYHLKQHQNQLTMEADSARIEMIDYYTMWVHQIKTPIAAISLLLQTDERLAACDAELSGELFKIEQYVEMVLQYLRLDGPKRDLLLKQYSLDSIVREAVHKYAKQFIRKRISLNFEELDCQVLTDEKWLTFVIEQLLSNALKYTPKGSISIYMEHSGREQFAPSGAPCTKVLVIEDTGIGISSEDLPRIFEKGYTGVNGRMDKKSTGIGLYLCRRILDNLSHQITITSRIGRGTKVFLYLDTAPLEVE